MADEVENTAPPSTPITAAAIPSSDAPAIEPSSPASSPPDFPWERRKEDGTKQSYQAPERNVFSVLGKRKVTPLSDNVMTSSMISKKTRRSDDGKTQMQLHLGQKIQKRCKDCGMQYIASSNEDRQLHAKFHKRHTEGVDVGATFVENAPTDLGRRVYNGTMDREEDKIVVVDCYDKSSRRRKGQEVLEIVQRDLGAVEIAEAAVWEPPKVNLEEPKFRSLMYVRDGKCVGYVLVERISEAFEVLPPTLPHDESARVTSILSDQSTAREKTSALAALQTRKFAAEIARARKEAALQAAAKKPLVLSQSGSPARLGICRIWTLPPHRGQGIAAALLDAAVKWHNDHVYFLKQGLAELEQKKTPENADGTVFAQKLDTLRRSTVALKSIEKQDVAFSQPTAAGTKLARKWSGKLSGWQVYVD